MSLEEAQVESWVQLQVVPPNTMSGWGEVWPLPERADEEDKARHADPWRVLRVPSTNQYRVINVETGEMYRLTVRAEVTLERGP